MFFIGSSGNAIVIFNGDRRKQELQIGPPNGSNHISEIQIDSEDQLLWCGGDFGLIQLSYQKGVEIKDFIYMTDLKFIPVSKVNTLLHESDSSKLCATESGLKRILLNEFNQLESSQFESTASVKTALIDNKETIWMDQGPELWYFENDSLFQFKGEENLFSKWITDMKLCQDGSICISTYGNGIVFIKDKKIIHHLTEENGLPSNICHQIQISGQKHYIASNDGCIMYDWDGSQTQNITSVKEQHGLPSKVVNDVLLSDSLIYLATAGGLVILQTEEFQGLSTEMCDAPQLNLKSFSSRDSTYNINEPIVLFHNESYFKINYQALVFDQPNYASYSYRFSEDQEWVNTNSTSLEFPNLSQGPMSSS